MKFFLFFILFCPCLFAGYLPFQECFPKNAVPTKLKKAEYFIAAYEKNHFEKVKQSQKPRIPKIIHHIWLGSPLPEMFKKYVDSWKTHHPDWEHRLWTDKDLESFPFVTGKLICKARNFGQKSDIFRIEILNKFGGLYVDTDFLCLQSHDRIHHTCDFYSGMFNHDVLTGIIGSIPNHPILVRYLEEMSKCSLFEARAGENNIRKAFDVLKATGPYLFSNIVREQLEDDDSGIVMYPNVYYYSFPGKSRHMYWSKEDLDVVKPYLSEHALAVHLWATSWHNIQSPLRNKNRPLQRQKMP